MAGISHSDSDLGGVGSGPKANDVGGRWFDWG